MTRVLVLYYSSYGHVRALAQAEAEGARSVPGTHVDLRRVPETVPEAIRQKAGFAADDTPVAAPADLESYDAIIFGTPTLFGMMAGQMKSFLDQAGGLWARNALVGKVAAVFASTGSQHGGHEATLLSTQIPLQHFGMLIAGMPYTFAGQTTAEGIVGGAPYGAGTIAGADGSRAPSETDLAGARYQGAHVARIAARLAGANLRGGGRVMPALTIDFFHDVVCCWCFNISSRMRRLAAEFDLDIRHRTFVLQADRFEMARRWGSPEDARAAILMHWDACRRVSDAPGLIDIGAMAAAPFDYPHGMTAALACKAAERLGGQAAHWDMFDRLQRAHLTEARDIADPATVLVAARRLGFEAAAFAELLDDPATRAAVEADRQQARALQVHSVPTLIIRETGTRLVNGPQDDLAAQLRAARRLAGWKGRS